MWSSKRKPITRKRLKQLVELMEQPIEPSISDEALIRAVMAHHGWSYDEARKRLELSGMQGRRPGEHGPVAHFKARF